jgi:DNA helicase-2/ATP-dependent DNA helicase PcrA
MNTEILEQLNESQRVAVEYCDGASLVIAGAGSGKTRVLTYKIAWLLQQGDRSQETGDGSQESGGGSRIRPWNILALTFTNKAAREMKERIGRLVGEEEARYLQMGTFHSVFARILRAEAEKIGYNPNFTIYDQSDARSLVKTIIKEMGLDDKVYKPSSVADRISMAKNHLLLPQAYQQSAWASDDASQKRPQVSNIYIRYAQRCQQANAMDFDDLLVQTWVLFQNHEDVRRKYVEKFHFVLVDEYQDTNFAQQAIVYQLTKERQKVCVVGDDAQSIYSFRGANIDNILNFQSQYTNARLFKLEQNYRSTQLIVQAANSLIRRNERQIPKNVFSKNEHGERLQLKPAYSDKEEAMIVTQDIKRLRKQDHCNWSDFAILYRTNSQSRSFEEQMRRDNIPYRIYGGLSFYQRKEIKDVIAYFRLIANPNDEEAFKRIINYPSRGIGDTTVGKIIQTAQTYGVSLWQVIKEPVLFPMDVSKGTMTKIQAFRQLIEGWIGRINTEDAYTLGHDIIMTSGISKDIYSGRNPEDISRQENLEEFLSGMQDFVESRKEEDMGDEIYLPDFLQEVALLTDLDSDEGDSNDKVTLMTIHSAKGLEFPTVFVVGLEENIFPSPMCTNSMRELEEERRLLYVAITRAEKHCILTCAQNRFRYGRMEYDTPSRFIRDIDPELLDVHSESGGGSSLFGSSSHKAYNRYDGGAYGTGNTGGYSRTSRGYESEGPEWMQNPRPVATQFKADPKPRAVAPRQPEKPVDPFGEGFKRLYQQQTGKPLSASGSPQSASRSPQSASRSPQSASRPAVPSSGNFRPVSRAVPPRPMASDASASDLREGVTIEHQRFGIGTVVKIEGTGENTKATVEFRNTGTKQLLLKFAKFKIIG